MKKLFVLFALFLTACGQQPVGTLSVEAVEDMYKKGVPVVDIRVPEMQQETGVLPGSHLITVFDSNNRFTPDTFNRIAEIAGGKDQPVLLMSETGRRSSVVVKMMVEQLGFTQVYHAASGISGWQAQGKPLVPPEQ